MSFGLTREQLLDGSKTVTRRNGWTYAKAGDVYLAVNKVMGFRRPERALEYGTVEVLEVRREPLEAITAEDVAREGFPGKSPQWFVDFYRSHMRCLAAAPVTRIAFRFTAKPGGITP